MPEHDRKLCGTSSQAITFDAAPQDFALLLDMIDNRPITNPYKWSDLVGVMELGAKFQFFHLDRHIYAHVMSKRPTEGNPWMVFALASRLDLPLVARSTIVDLGYTHLPSGAVDQVKAKDMEGVAGKYATALLQAMRQNSSPETYTVFHPVTGTGSRCHRSSWLGVSRDFDLSKWSVPAKGRFMVR
jgi:hypothetical protein